MLPAPTLAPLGRARASDPIRTAAGLVLYLNAYDFAGLPDGTALALWTGREAAAAAWVQGTAGKRPTKQTQGGAPVVRFVAASSQGLSITSYTALQLLSKTVCFVARNSSSVNATRVLLGTTNANYYEGGSNLDKLLTSHQNTVPAAKNVISSGAQWDTALHVYTFRWTVSGVNVTVGMWRDGAAVATGTATFADGAAAVTTTTWFLGSLTASNFWDGDIGAVVVSSDVTEATRQLIERTLGPRWGIPVA